MTADDLKRQAALRAVEYVHEGMDVGLGTGSTAEHAVREIGRRVREEALSVRCVATSDKISRLATEVGIKVVTLEECPQLDVTIDGADEIVLGHRRMVPGTARRRCRPTTKRGRRHRPAGCRPRRAG